MIQPTYTIYWILDGYAGFEDTNDMVYALRRAEQLRKSPGYRAVTFCSENPNQVGKPGVDTIKDGILPDGQEYLWVKRRDGA